MKRLLVADDHTLLREVVVSLLRKKEEFLVEEASSFKGVERKISDFEHFDVILLDFAMLGMRGMDSVKRIVETNKPGAVALFNGNLNKALLQCAFSIGVKGYIPKTMRSDALAIAVTLIASGESYVPSEYYCCSKGDEIFESLTDQQVAILSCLCRGYTNKEIAQELNISESNVKTQVRSVLMALDAQNRTQAVITASLSGWIPL